MGNYIASKKISAIYNFQRKQQLWITSASDFLFISSVTQIMIKYMIAKAINNWYKLTITVQHGTAKAIIYWYKDKHPLGEQLSRYCLYHICSIDKFKASDQEEDVSGQLDFTSSSCKPVKARPVLPTEVQSVPDGVCKTCLWSELPSDCQQLVSIRVACVPERIVANRRNLPREPHSKKTFAWLVDAFVLKPSTSLVRAQKYKLLVEKVKRATLSSKTGKLENLLVAFFVFAENLNLPWSWQKQCYSRSTDKGVWCLWLVAPLHTCYDRSLVGDITSVTV